VSIIGGGLITGKALHGRQSGEGATNPGPETVPQRDAARFSILAGGHFGILLTGVDNLTVDNLKIDSNYDGMDVDACHNVRISNTTVNSPNDDAMVLKSSHGLGFKRSTENVTITNVMVSGYDVGSVLDGTYTRNFKQAAGPRSPHGPDQDRHGSEGDFKKHHHFQRSVRPLPRPGIESVDGSHVEDIAISNITMQDVSTARFSSGWAAVCGRRRCDHRVLRRVSISNVVVYDAEPRFGSIISGIPATTWRMSNSATSASCITAALPWIRWLNSRRPGE